MKAMLFAAGLGTRLKPFTDTAPKALLPLAGKTLLEWQIEKLRRAGITDIVINVHHFAEQIIDYLQVNNSFDCRITISDEREKLLDTGGGLYHAAPLLLPEDPQDTAPILVCNVDILSNISLADLRTAYDGYAQNAVPMGVLVVSPRTTQRYLLFDSEQRLCGWTNIATGEVRPASASAQHAEYQRLAFSGMQLLSPRIFPLLAPLAAQKGGVFSLIDAYLSLCADHSFYAYTPHDYRMMDVGKTAQLTEAERFAASLG